MECKTYQKRFIRHLIGSPFIYAMIVPFIVLDIFLEIYHRICFPLYGLAYIKRSSYIRIDRQKLSYLNGLDKLNCMYCGYANGLLHYASVIASETEKYWCGIKHSSAQGFVPPKHHTNFLEYGDERTFHAKIVRKKD